MTKTYLSASILAATLATSFLSTSAVAADDKIKVITTEAQPLHHALVAIGLKYDVTVIAPYALTKGKKAKALSGKYSAQEAINTLLEGTQLALYRSDNGSFVIQSKVQKNQRSGNQTTNIEHIEVLGEKAKRKLIDATSSVSVFSEETLRDMTYLNVSNAVGEVANVVVLSGQAPTIRGVSGNGSAGGFNGVSGGAKPRVSTLIDGVSEPFVADLTGDSNVWDIQQIEVFRGPQSTISGRNSMGGIVFIKTLDPTFDWSGAMRVGYRSKDRFIDTSGVISGPVIEDELAFRLSVQHLDGEYADQEIIFPENPASFDLNGLETTQVRGKLLWLPEAVKDLSILYTFSDLDEQGNSGRKYYRYENTFDFIPAFERDIKTENTTHSLDFDYALNNDYAIDLLISDTNYDYGFTSYEPTPRAQQTLLIQEDNWFVDGRLNFGLSAQNYTGYIGLSHYSRKQDYRSTSAFPYFGKDKTDATSIYGELSFNLNEQITLITGGRIEDEEQYRDITTIGRDGSLNQSVLDRSKKIYLPKLVLQYRFTDSMVGSLSARKGYNGGGGALLYSTGEYYYFDAETVVTYESGIRHSFDNNKGFVNASLFYNDYTDYQGTDQQRRISNIEQVNTYGLELEFNYMLTEDLQVRAGLGLLESEIKDSSGQYDAINGNELSVAPNTTASLGFEYWLNDELKIGTSTNYIAEFYGDFNNSDSGLAGNYTITRFSVSYEKGDWRLTVNADNVFDKQAYTLRTPPTPRVPGGASAVEDPRTLSASLTYTF